MTFLLLLLALFSGLFSAGTTNDNSQTKARDTERKNDINSMYQKIEEHYNDFGEYPTERELVQQHDTKLPGLDPDALIDPYGDLIQSGEYSYTPSSCTAIGCEKYILSARLEDGSNYTKDSLN